MAIFHAHSEWWWGKTKDKKHPSDIFCSQTMTFWEGRKGEEKKHHEHTTYHSIHVHNFSALAIFRRKPSPTLHAKFIYIYIYMCVCVCECSKSTDKEHMIYKSMNFLQSTTSEGRVWMCRVSYLTQTEWDYSTPVCADAASHAHNEHKHTGHISDRAGHIALNCLLLTYAV